MSNDIVKVHKNRIEGLMIVLDCHHFAITSLLEVTTNVSIKAKLGDIADQLLAVNQKIAQWQDVGEQCPPISDQELEDRKTQLAALKRKLQDLKVNA